MSDKNRAAGSTFWRRSSQPGQPAKPAGRLQTIGEMVEKAARRPRQPWTNEVFEPDSDVDYTRVLAGDGQRAATTVAGIMGVVIVYILVMPLIAGGIVWIGWRARGQVGIFAIFQDDALGSFAYPEGMAASFLALAAFIPIVVLLVRFVHQRPPVWVSSVQPGIRWRFLLICAGVSAVVFNVVYWMTSGRIEFHWSPMSNTWLWVGIVVVLSPLQAAGEEYLFRGYLTQVLGSVLRRPWLVIGLSGVLFTAAHGLQNVPLMADRFAFGCIMGALVVGTGGLEAAIAAHAVNNVFAFGYPVLSNTLAQARAISTISWSTAATNILAYAAIALISWRIGVAMKVATETPMRKRH